MASIIVSFF